jgi:hypothetical protein
LTEEDEQGREDLSLLVGPVHGVLLDRIRFEAVGREDGPYLVHRLARVPAGLDRRTPVGDEDLVDPSFLAGELLEVFQRHNHRGVGGGIGPALVDAGDLEPRGA